MSSFDPRALRDAFGSFMTGVTVVTTHDAAGAPWGLTVNSFTSVSLDPPLLLICLAKATYSFAIFTTAPGFAVNILAQGQSEISKTFSQPGKDRFSGLGWHARPHGAPILDGVAAWFVCARHEVVDAGDHVILIGRVEDFAASDRAVLGYVRGEYTNQNSLHSSMVMHEPKVMVGAIIHGPKGVLLVREGSGWGIPRLEMTGARGSFSALDRLVGSVGLLALFGFIYAVYEDSGVQHIVYRCEVADQMPLRGAFQNLSTTDLREISDPAARGMLSRFARESRNGQFSIYCGNARRGEVRD